MRTTLRRFAVPWAAALLLLLSPALLRAEQDDAPDALLDRVVGALKVSFPDAAEAIAARAEPHRAPLGEASTLDGKRAAVFAFLTEVPTSHCGLLTTRGHAYAIADLMGEDALTLGLALARVGEGYFATGVMRQGPAARAGIRRGDEVVSIDGIPTASSPRLDFRHDDAALGDAPTHWVRCEEGVPVAFVVRRRAEDAATEAVVVTPGIWSSLRSDRAGVAALAVGGRSIGVIPLSLVYPRQTVPLVTEAMTGPLKACDGLVLDGRGRGGSAQAVQRLLGALADGDARAGRPMVLLVDRDTRSAKEILAAGFHSRGIGPVVGEPTPGAVRPVRFVPVGSDTVLFCPVPTTLAKPRFPLEGVGVEPDVFVRDVFAFADGRDPILEAGVATAVEALGAGTPAEAAGLLEAGDALFGRRAFDEARETYERAAETAAASGEAGVEVEALAQVARTLSATRRLEEGRAWLARATAKATPEQQIAWNERGIAAAERANDEGWLAVLWNNLGATYDWDLHDYAKALDCYLVAKRYHDRTGGPIQKIGADWAVGRAALLTGDRGLAEAHLARALARARALHARGASHDTWEWLGNAEQWWGELHLKGGARAAALRHLRAGRDALVEADIGRWWPEEKERLDRQIAELEAAGPVPPRR